MQYSEIIIAVIGVLSSIVTWFLGRRQSNLNADSTEITNLRESLTTYKDLVESLRQQISIQNEQIVALTKQVADLNTEIIRLKSGCV